MSNSLDGSPAGSAVPWILQARTLEWVAISFSNAGKWKVKVKLLGLVRFFVTPWTAAYQAHPSMGFSRQEYWSGLPLPSPKYCTKLSTKNSGFEEIASKYTWHTGCWVIYFKHPTGKQPVKLFDFLIWSG